MSEFYPHDLERDPPDHLERGLLLFEQRCYDQARRELELALQIEPQNARAHAWLAMTLLELGELKAASEAARRAVETNPDQSFGHYAQARTWRRRNQAQNAQEAIDRALALEPDNSTYLAHAALLAVDRRAWDEAIQLADQGLALDPEGSDCHNVRALAMIRKGQVLPAREALLGLLARDPHNPLTLANLGWVALHRHQREEALDFFSRSLAENAEDSYARDGLLESLRLQYPFYGIVLRYMLWVSRFSEKAQWGLTLGLYFLRKALEDLARNNRRLRPWIQALLWAMSVFNYMTFTARPVTSLLLRLNPYGRRILNQDEIDESNLIGLTLAGTLGFYLTHWLTGRNVWLLASLVMLTIALPASSIYECEKGGRRTLMAVYTAGLFLLGVWGVWDFWQSPLTGGRSQFSLYGIGLLIGQHLGHLLSSTRDRQ